MRLLSLGLGNKELATRFGVSETAIKKRLCRLMRYLGATNRTMLVRAAFLRGLISTNDEAAL